MGRRCLNRRRLGTHIGIPSLPSRLHLGISMELLTPYLQAASVVSLSLSFTCAVVIFPRNFWACSVAIPAFSAAWGDEKGHRVVSALCR